MTVEPTFAALIQSIRQAHDELAAQASKAVNLSLTLRNWLIGHHIAEYELKGRDRAQYGDRLFSELARELRDLSNCNRRQLYRYHRLYTFFPQIVGSLPPQFKSLVFPVPPKVGTLSPQSSLDDAKPASKLSYSHFDELVELKLEAFNHNNLGQLNSYVNWYRQNMMTPGDNPPVGLLLCTHKNHALVEYALAGMDNQLFISKYQLELPPKEQMLAFLDSQLKSMGDHPARGKESLSGT